jgi:iduronate 2-sulfatase
MSLAVRIPDNDDDDNTNTTPTTIPTNNSTKKKCNLSLRSWILLIATVITILVGGAIALYATKSYKLFIPPSSQDSAETGNNNKKPSTIITLEPTMSTSTDDNSLSNTTTSQAPSTQQNSQTTTEDNTNPSITTPKPSSSPTTRPIPTRKPTTKTPTTSSPSTKIPTTPSPTYFHLGNKANVLIIICDDLKPLIMSYGGVSSVNPPTPNMDRIVKNGVRFLNAHAQMSLCGPSRASFLTSLRPDTLNLYSLDENALFTRIQNWQRYQSQTVMTIPKLFKQNGYVTYGIGKVFHESEKVLMADVNTWTTPVFSWLDNWVRNPSFSKPYVGSWINNPEVQDTYFPDGQAASLASQLITTLANRPSTNNPPWLLMVGLWKPHLPWSAPMKYFNSQQPAFRFPGAHHGSVPYGMDTQDFALIKGTGCEEIAPYGPPDNLAGWDLSLSQEQSANWAYSATVSYADAQIGLILDTLANSTDALTTHVILLGDHGFHLGDHGLWCKHTNFEQGTRVPFIISPAPIETFRVRNKASVMPVELLDLMPTLAELCELPINLKNNPSWAKWEGVSLVPLLNNPSFTMSVKAGSISQYFRGSGDSKYWGYSMRTIRYRFTVWCPSVMQFKPLFSKCIIELYDYLLDRYETRNLALIQNLRSYFINNVDWTGADRFNSLQGKIPFDIGNSNGMMGYYMEDIDYF